MITHTHIHAVRRLDLQPARERTLHFNIAVPQWKVHAQDRQRYPPPTANLMRLSRNNTPRDPPPFALFLFHPAHHLVHPNPAASDSPPMPGGLRTPQPASSDIPSQLAYPPVQHTHSRPSSRYPVWHLLAKRLQPFLRVSAPGTALAVRQRRLPNRWLLNMFLECR